MGSPSGFLSVWFPASTPLRRTLRVQLVQITVEPIQVLLPVLLVIVDPTRGVLQPLCLQSAGPPLRFPPAHDQSGALQHFQMLGYGRQAHVERPRKLADRNLPGSDARENRPARGIGEGREGRAQ